MCKSVVDYIRTVCAENLWPLAQNPNQNPLPLRTLWQHHRSFVYWLESTRFSSSNVVMKSASLSSYAPHIRSPFIPLIPCPAVGRWSGVCRWCRSTTARPTRSANIMGRSLGSNEGVFFGELLSYFCWAAYFSRIYIVLVWIWLTRVVTQHTIVCCSMQIVDITPMKHHSYSSTSLYDVCLTHSQEYAALDVSFI
jgi:hypothetical protein